MKEFLENMTSMNWEEISAIINAFFSTGIGVALVTIYSKYKLYKFKTPEEITNLISTKVTEVINNVPNILTPIISDIIDKKLSPIIEAFQIQSNNMKTLVEAQLLAKGVSTECMNGLIEKLSEVTLIDEKVLELVKTDVQEQVNEQIAVNTELEKLEELENQIEKINKTEDIVNAL